MVEDEVIERDYDLIKLSFINNSKVFVFYFNWNKEVKYY